VSSSSSESQRAPDEPLSPTPHRQQQRHAELRAGKSADNLTADLRPFYEVNADQTKCCKFCL